LLLEVGHVLLSQRYSLSNPRIYGLDSVINRPAYVWPISIIFNGLQLNSFESVSSGIYPDPTTMQGIAFICDGTALVGLAMIHATRRYLQLSMLHDNTGTIWRPSHLSLHCVLLALLSCLARGKTEISLLVMCMRYTSNANDRRMWRRFARPVCMNKQTLDYKEASAVS
jgi:hypothetical protein